MGHLVNPIAFRLGWSRQWVDNYFADLRFYPELLHRVLRFRYFLNCFFSNKIPPVYFDVYVISHFSFYLDLEGFGLKIFYYNSRMDPCWYDFWDKISPRPYGLRFFPKARHEPPTFAPWNRKSLSLLFILYHYAVNGVFDQPYQYRLPFFKAYQDSLQPAEFAKIYPRYLWKKYQRRRREGIYLSERECFVFLHMMRYRTLQETGRINYTFPGYGLRMVNYEAVAQTFFRLLYVHQITKPYMQTFYEWLKFLGTYFFLKQPFAIRFFQVNNDQLSARFIAKFLALRFRQGFSVRTVLRPIRKDLRFSKKLASRMHYKASELKRTAFERSGHGKLTSFIPLFLSSRKYTDRLWFGRKNMVAFDEFFFAFSLKKLKYRSFYKLIRFFSEKRMFLTLVHHLTVEARRLYFLKGYFYAFFYEMAFNHLLSYHIGRQVSSNPGDLFSVTSSTLCQLTGGVLLSFLNFSVQSSIPARSTDTFFGVKRRNFRLAKAPALGLQGFRIRLHGRFTRKQIAASYHFQEGSMPTSSMNAFIDYAFTTIPLRNSAIGIKVWLYKGGSPDQCELTLTF